MPLCVGCSSFLSLFVGNPAFSDGFQKGLTAYKNGDYETASREWNPLAKQGNTEAQYNLGIMYLMGEGIVITGMQQKSNGALMKKE